MILLRFFSLINSFFDVTTKHTLTMHKCCILFAFPFKSNQFKKVSARFSFPGQLLYGYYVHVRFIRILILQYIHQYQICVCFEYACIRVTMLIISAPIRYAVDIRLTTGAPVFIKLYVRC